MNLRTLTILLLALATAPLAARADDIEPLARLQATAEGYVGAQLGAGAEVHADGLDQRLRLPACAETPTPARSGGASGTRWTVALSCSAPRAWTIYVPVRVSRLQAVLVATRNLPAGSTLADADLRSERRDTANLLQGAVGDIALARGQALAQPLAAGAVLTPAALTRPAQVRRGDSVVLVSRSAGFEVRAGGKALANGAVGERIAIENSSSRRVVQGVVRADGSVEIAF